MYLSIIYLSTYLSIYRSIYLSIQKILKELHKGFKGVSNESQKDHKELSLEWGFQNHVLCFLDGCMKTSIVPFHVTISGGYAQPTT